MTELDRALSQLEFIQTRFAASTRFQGFAPQAVAATGVLALSLAAAQALWPASFGADWSGFIAAWIAAAAVATALVGIEALGRSRRLHGAMSDMLIAGTLRLLLPFGAVGAAMTAVILTASPETGWILPGLWQMLIALLGFSATATLPRTILWPAAWYFLCGTVVLLISAGEAKPEPWTMGAPFGIGQLLVAWVLHRAAGEADG